MPPNATICVLRSQRRGFASATSRPCSPRLGATLRHPEVVWSHLQEVTPGNVGPSVQVSYRLACSRFRLGYAVAVNSPPGRRASQRQRKRARESARTREKSDGEGAAKSDERMPRSAPVGPVTRRNFPKEISADRNRGQRLATRQLCYKQNNSI